MNQPFEMNPMNENNLPPIVIKRNNPVFDVLGALFYPILFMALQYIVSLVASVAVTFAVMFSGAGEAEATDIIYNYFMSHANELLIIADVLLIGILLLWFGCRKKSIPKSFEMRKVKISTILLAIVAGIGLNFALNYVMELAYVFFPKTMQEYEELMSSQTVGNPITYVVAGVILAPIVEELVFRALSLKHLDRVVPRWLAIILIAGLFGLVHGNIVQGLYAGALGILLCCMFFAYDTVWVPMALHFGFNLVSVISLIDVTEMSESTVMLISFVLYIVQLIATMGGIIAIVFLFLKRTRPIFVKPKDFYESPELAEIIPASPVQMPLTVAELDQRVIYNGMRNDAVSDRPPDNESNPPET